MPTHPPKSNWKEGFLGFLNDSAKKTFFLFLLHYCLLNVASNSQNKKVFAHDNNL